MRIRTHLLSLAFAALLPALVAAMLGVGYVYIEARDVYRKNLAETARASALFLDSELQSTEALLQVLASSPSLKRGDFRIFYQFAIDMANNNAASVVLYDTAHKEIFDTDAAFGRAEASDRAGLSAQRSQRGPAATIVSGIYYSKRHRTYRYAVEIPVRLDGRIPYYVRMDLNASRLQRILEKQNLPAGWIGSVVDSNAIIAARSQNAERLVGKPATGGIRDKLLASAEGFNEGRTLNNVPVLAAYSRAPFSGWTFVISVPQHELRSAAARAAAFLGGVLLLLLALSIAGALLLARKTALPIESLRRSAERLGRGEAVHPRHYTIAEMNKVHAAMVQASEELQSGRAELETRVAEATANAERSHRALLQAQKLEALGRLTGGIAHDFNNVLQTLTSGLQLARISANEPRLKTLLDTCQSAVERAVELTRKLMAFGRVQDARLETIDVAAQMRATLPLLQGGLPSHVDLRLTVADDLWPVTMDKLQFELALLNLTMNARDAMPEGGILNIEAFNETLEAPVNEIPAGRYVCVTVADSGEGMNQEVLAKAFDPFFTTKSIGKGSGMGLPQAYAFARQTGGTLLLQSELGKGTKAVFYLPASERAVDAAHGDRGRDLPSADPGRVILFVEDDKLVRDVVFPALRASGFEVLTASSSEEAIALLETQGRIDLVFSDIVMPGRMNGLELAETIRIRFPTMRVVLATGYSEHRISLPGIRILPKPYDIGVLVDVLNAELHKRP